MKEELLDALRAAVVHLDMANRLLGTNPEADWFLGYAKQAREVLCRFQNDEPPEKKNRITIELSPEVHGLLEVLTKSTYAPNTVKGVIESLIDHAQQGIYRPGSWERDWLCKCFTDDFTEHLEDGDPYGRPNSPMFQRPKTHDPKTNGG